MNVLESIDNRISLSDEELMIVESVKALARDQIALRAAEHDREGTFPKDNVDAINALGLNAMFIPAEYGGAQLSFTCYALCVREIAKACASTGIIWATNFHAIKPLIEYGSEAQKQRFLPAVAEGALASLAITEPDAGSDATGMRTSFREDGDDIVINGGKTFITNGDVADLYLLFGKWAGIDDPKRSISVLMLEKGTPGLKVLRTEDTSYPSGGSFSSSSFVYVAGPPLSGG